MVFRGRGLVKDATPWSRRAAAALRAVLDKAPASKTGLACDRRVRVVGTALGGQRSLRACLAKLDEHVENGVYHRIWFREVDQVRRTVHHSVDPDSRKPRERLVASEPDLLKRSQVLCR